MTHNVLQCYQITYKTARCFDHHCAEQQEAEQISEFYFMWKVIVGLHFVQDDDMMMLHSTHNQSILAPHHFLSQLEAAHSNLCDFKIPQLHLGFLKPRRSSLTVTYSPVTTNSTHK